MAPNIIVPRATSLTDMPVPPRILRSMGLSLTTTSAGVEPVAARRGSHLPRPGLAFELVAPEGEQSVVPVTHPGQPGQAGVLAHAVVHVPVVVLEPLGHIAPGDHAHRVACLERALD